MSDKIGLEHIFDEIPVQWGLRGDPYFWEYLKNLLSQYDKPISEDELEKLIYDEYLKKSGEALVPGSMDYVDEFSNGGMSSGLLSSDFWIFDAIPMLKERLKKYYEN